MYSLFDSHIEKFNEMYGFQCNKAPTDLGLKQIENFLIILLKEVGEAGSILTTQHPSERLVALADWLGDIIVYCASEGKKHGLPMGDIVNAIMESNFTKLGLDGKPIIGANGKLLKGPSYTPPESEIERILFGAKDVTQ